MSATAMPTTPLRKSQTVCPAERSEPEPLAEEEHGREDEEDRQDVFEKVHPERMDLLSGDAEKDDRNRPEDGRDDRKDLPESGKRLGGAEDIVHRAGTGLTFSGAGTP